MNKALKVFHTINEALTRMESAPKGEAVMIAEALKRINEELCDKFIEILNDRHEGRTAETNSNR